MSNKTIVRYKFSITKRNVVITRCYLPEYWDWVGYSSRADALAAARAVLDGRIAKAQATLATARILNRKLDDGEVMDREDNSVTCGRDSLPR